MPSSYLERPLRSEAEARYGAPDDFAAYLSDFFEAFFVAMREEEQAAAQWERESVERMNYQGRQS